MTPALESRIIALAKVGKPPRLIRASLNDSIEINRIYAVLRRARRSGILIRKFPPGLGRSEGARTIVFPASILDRLTPFAAVRRMTVNDLVRHLIKTALDDGLIDALLDDDAPEPGETGTQSSNTPSAPRGHCGAGSSSSAGAAPHCGSTNGART